MNKERIEVNGTVTRIKAKVGTHSNGYNRSFHSYMGITIDDLIHGKLWFSCSAQWVNNLREGDRIVGSVEVKERKENITFCRCFKLVEFWKESEREKHIKQEINSML